MLKLNLYGDEQYIERIRNNDRQLLSELFIRYERMVFHYVSKNGGSRQDGEDMLQEAIVVLWENSLKADFKLSSKLSTYIMAVVKNKWLAELRKGRKIENKPDLPDNPSEEQNALENLVNSEFAELITNALNIISDICRKILLMYYYEQRSTKEIAEQLKLANADVVKSKKYQCKKSLQQVLKKMNVSAEGRA